MSSYATKIQKLSDKGWSFNERYLIKDSTGLAYYSKPPDKSIIEKMIHPPKLAPKLKLAEYQASKLNDDDIKKYKKLNPQLAFKIAYTDSPATDTKAGKPNVTKYWYFQTDAHEQQLIWLSKLNDGASQINSEELEATKQESKAITKYPTYLEKIPETKEEGSQKSSKPASNRDIAASANLPQLKEESKDAYKSKDGNKSEIVDKSNEALSKSVAIKSNKSQHNEEENKSDSDKSLSLSSNEDIKGETKFNIENEDNKLKEDMEEIHVKQQNLYETKKANESMAWDLKFQLYWELLINSQKNCDENMKASERLFDLIGKFKRTSSFFVELIVNKMHLQDKYEKKKRHESKNHSVQLKDELGKDEKGKEFIYISDDAGETPYIFNKMVIKLANRNTSLVHKNEETKFECVEPAWKAYEREFLSMDVLFDALFVLSKPDSKYKLRVPLSCFVNYKGFSALVTAEIPMISELDPTIGLNNEGKYLTTQSKTLISQLAYVGEVLNLKEHNFYFGESLQKVYISPLIEIHKRNNAADQCADDDKANTKEIDLYKAELGFNEEVYYILKTKEIFPIDPSFIDKRTYDCYLRPEFLNSYAKPIRSDIMKKRLGVLKKGKTILDNRDLEEERSIDFAEQRRYLEEYILVELLKDFESLTIIPIDSKSLTIALHSYGVNMRYLGKLFEMSRLDHLKEIFAVEMLARRCKHHLSDTITDIIEEQSLNPVPKSEGLNKPASEVLKSYDPEKFFDEDYILAGEFDKKQYIELLQEKMHCDILEYVVDFLNLVFGASNESNFFWEGLSKKTAEYYSLTGDPNEILKKSKINLRALVFALIYHMGLNLTFEEKTEINRTEKPFQIEDLKGITPKTKIYSMRTVVYKSLAERYKAYREQHRNALSLKALKLKMTMSKYLDDTIDLVAVSEMAEILLEENLTKEAIEKAEDGLKMIHPLHADSVKFYCILMRAYCSHEAYKHSQKLGNDYFFKALKALDFHLGNCHPLHSTVYGIMACMNVSVVQYTQAEYLYLSSEKCCKRVLGANHIRTAEVYLDLGKLYWKMGKKDEAHKNIEKSYQIFEKLNDNVQIASSAFQLAIIYQDQRRFGEAMKFSKRASEIYQVLYSVNNMSNETLIISLWLTMCVAFSIGQDTVVLEQGGKILDEIKKRSTAKEINELLNDKIQAIQQKCAIGTIISTIRSQEYKQKRYTILIIEELYRTLEQTLNTTLELKNAFLDSIKLNEYAQKTLSAIIDQAEQYKNGVREYITGVVNGVQKAYGEMKEQPLVDNDNYALSPAIESTEREVLIKVLKMFDKKDLIFVLG